MSVQITWTPSTYPSIASYDVEVAAGSAGPYSFLANVPHNLSGPNFNVTTGLFFYAHSAGVVSNWYRLIAIDNVGNRSSPSAPIEPVSTTPIFTNTVKVDHNYGSPAALRYQTASGAPVEGALIRIYTKTAFDQGETNQPLAVTMTTAKGEWVNPVSLATGFTYVVQFAKEGLYGPDKVEVIV